MVRRLGPDRIPEALQLVNAEGWAFAAADFEAMLDLEPDGLFFAEVDGDLVGLTTTACYDGLGWIGNVVVHPDHRGHGLGTELVEAAVAHLQDEGAEAVGLYALPASRSLYRRLGFAPRGEVAVLTGDAGDDRSPTPDPALEAIVELDAAHVARDRSRYLRHLARQDGVQVAVEDDAYLMARPGRVWEIGPGVADPDRPAAREAVVERILQAVDGAVEASVPAGAPARKAFASHGLEASYRATTMTTEDVPLYDADAIAGLLGLAKG